MKLIFIPFLLIASLEANALLIADPDLIWTDAGSAHVVDTAFDGVTLSTNVDNGHVLALGSGVPGLTGWLPAVFGHGLINFPSGGCSGCWSFGFAELRADFDVFASSVSVDFIDRFAGTAIVEAYSTDGLLIDRSEAVLNGHPATEAERLSVEINDPANSIAYILAGANYGAYGVIDNLSWNIVSVSEPSMIVLMATGLIGLGIARRRRFRQAIKKASGKNH